jgi:hypothetical protein
MYTGCSTNGGLSRKYQERCMSILLFFFDSLVRKVWIEENSRPIVAVIGSHRHFCMFGAG